MKRIFAVALIMIMAISVFVGCSSDNEVAEVNPSDIISQINEKYPDAVKGLTELKEKSDLNRYYEIDEKDIDGFAAVINTDSSKAALEIVIVKTDNVEDVKQKLNIRYQAIISQYASYSAEQLKMAKEGGVEATDGYVYLVVAENAKDIMSLISESLS